ncbi:histone deacetylase family protein [Kordiimonas pumila]|uniref:Histone deacetylase family protein n=1 Tax=Kordiimonas pumila TaxID=2161677 RepID=A0ABV7D0G1_9PROT|nr:histone deacetylase family protein [Kordiimonas pumila]
MRFFYSDTNKKYDPETFYRKGTVITHPERAIRATILHDALTAAGFSEGPVKDYGLAPVLAVHTKDYVDFLSTFWAKRAEINADSTEFIPTHFPRLHMHHKPTGLEGLLGYYSADTSTAIQAGTWDAVYGAAQVALSAADEMLATGVAYALCRPPGHHAYADCSGGFCYLNNTAIAAHYIGAQKNGPVAILDIDVHHGNGTQGIFYNRGDMLTVSIHADPSNYFPYYAGYAEETGEGAGKGANVNMPLAHKTGDDAYLAALEKALDRIRDFKPSALVVALGLDASEHDPIGVLKITTEGFNRIARKIAAAGYPTLLVQEGGYLTEQLPLNLVSFIRGFKAETA